MEIRPTTLPGCFEILLPHFPDPRGSFVKSYHQNFFQEQGLVTDWRENYYTISKRGVLRGLHFQSPPADHEKLVHCARGRAFDVVVDLRRGSPTYGRRLTLELSPERANQLYIPRGLAHGFLALEDETMMMYQVSGVHSPQHDQGILWNSCGVPWPGLEIILSERDKTWPTLAQFETPFVLAT